MATWNDPCPQCGAELYCAHRPDPARAGRRLALVPDPPRQPAPEPPIRNGRASCDLDSHERLPGRYRATRMIDWHGKRIVSAWVRGTVHASLVAAPMRPLAVPGEPFTYGQWTEPAWMTYLVWDDAMEPMDGGLLERHYDRVADKVTWHPVGSATVTEDLGTAIRLVLSITDARTWEA